MLRWDLIWIAVIIDIIGIENGLHVLAVSPDAPASSHSPKICMLAIDMSYINVACSLKCFDLSLNEKVEYKTQSICTFYAVKLH